VPSPDSANVIVSLLLADTGVLDELELLHAAAKATKAAVSAMRQARHRTDLAMRTVSLELISDS
jgi:hypothetical protein